MFFFLHRHVNRAYTFLFVYTVHKSWIIQYNLSGFGNGLLWIQLYMRQILMFFATKKKTFMNFKLYYLGHWWNSFWVLFTSKFLRGGFWFMFILYFQLKHYFEVKWILWCKWKNNGEINCFRILLIIEGTVNIYATFQASQVDKTSLSHFAFFWIKYFFFLFFNYKI